MKRFRTEFEHAAGILLAGAAIQIIDLLVLSIYPVLAGTKVLFARGLWAGTGAAAVLGIYMSHSIEKALSMESEKAERYMERVYTVQLFGIIGSAAAVYYFKPGYVMAAFLGLMCLKFGDFFRPAVTFILDKLNGRGKR